MHNFVQKLNGQQSDIVMQSLLKGAYSITVYSDDKGVAEEKIEKEKHYQALLPSWV